MFGAWAARKGKGTYTKVPASLSPMKRRRVWLWVPRCIPPGLQRSWNEKEKRRKCNQNSLRLQRAWSNSMKAPASGLQQGINFKPRCHRRSTLADNSGCESRKGAQGPWASEQIGSAWPDKAQAGASLPSLVGRATLLLSLCLCHGRGSPLLQPCHGKVGPS